jgi:hypothetical protein
MSFSSRNQGIGLNSDNTVIGTAANVLVENSVFSNNFLDDPLATGKNIRVENDLTGTALKVTLENSTLNNGGNGSNCMATWGTFANPIQWQNLGSNINDSSCN